MKSDKDLFWNQKMSVDEMDLHVPDISLVEAARAKVASRKEQHNHQKKWRFFGIFKLDIGVYQAGFAALLVACLVLYISQHKYTQKETYSEAKIDTSASINSSTVLASLTQYTNSKPSVNSSTVLTSIITFVAKN